MGVYALPYNSKNKISAHISAWELKCKCGGTHNITVNTDLIDKIEKLISVIATIKNVPVADIHINISSANRCKQYDIAVGGSGWGMHVVGKALDFNITYKNQPIDSKLIACIAQEIGFTGIGRIKSVGEYIHCDVGTLAEHGGKKWLGDETVAGGTLFADAPIGAIQAYGGTTAPLGWLLCQGQAVSRTTYADLFKAIGTAFGEGDSSTTFNIPDLRESTTKGIGLSGKSDNHYDSDGVALGEFVPDRIKSHAHNVYVRDAGHAHTLPQAYGAFPAGGQFVTPYSTSPYNVGTETGYANIQVNSSPTFTGESNSTTDTGFATNEVKAVGVNYIIKAKQVAVPADFMDAVDDVLSEFAKPISLQSLNGSTINFDKSRIVGGLVTICADIVVQSGSYLVKENAVVNVPNYGTASIAYILPCIYRNTASGAEEVGYALINTYGNLHPYYTKTEYNQIRINASYSSKA